MADYVYVGRSRPRVKVGVYQVLTLGIYGRVWMYKLLREFDGHEALFLDRRPYIPLLILPIVGPFLVKRRVAILVEDILHHDVTSPRFKRRTALLLGLIPLAPLFHLYVQKAINHHWRMHTKAEELDLKTAQLEQVQRRKSAEAQAEAKVLAKEVAQRKKELDDLQSAARALREAEELQRQAEEQGAVRKSRLGAIQKLAAFNPLRRREGDEGESAPDAKDSAEETTEPVPAAPARGRRRWEPEPTPPPEEVEDAAAEEPEEPGPRPGLLARFLPKRKPAGDAESEAEAKEPSQKEAGSTRAERKALRRKAKEERKAAKLAAKEERRKAKERHKAERRAAKEARKAEKARLKADQKAAKEAAKKADKKSAGRKKPKDTGKKEKSAPSRKKPAKKPK